MSCSPCCHGHDSFSGRDDIAREWSRSRSIFMGREFVPAVTLAIVDWGPENQNRKKCCQTVVLKPSLQPGVQRLAGFGWLKIEQNATEGSKLHSFRLRWEATTHSHVPFLRLGKSGGRGGPSVNSRFEIYAFNVSFGAWGIGVKCGETVCFLFEFIKFLVFQLFLKGWIGLPMALKTTIPEVSSVQSSPVTNKRR